MLALILVNTLVAVSSVEMAFTPPPPEIISPQPQKILSKTLKNSPSPTLPPKSTYREYITKPGDTIRKIAKEYYGSELYWTTIWNDNDVLTDAAMIHPGLKLKIRLSKPSETEKLARIIPTNTPVPTAETLKNIDNTQSQVTITPSLSPTADMSNPQGVQTGSPIGNFASVYLEAGTKYKIPWQILYAMHKVESGLRDGPVDSGAGPQGPMQFLPSTWAIHGVDGNGDGHSDINSAPDAIHAAANYLSKHSSLESGLNSYGRIKDDVFAIARSLGYNP